MSAIADITSQTRASTAQTQKTMDHLVEVALSLLRSISAFKLGVSSKPRAPMLLPPADVITEPLAIVTHPSGKLDPRRTKHLPTVDTMGGGRITHSFSPDTWPEPTADLANTGHGEHPELEEYRDEQLEPRGAGSVGQKEPSQIAPTELDGWQ